MPITIYPSHDKVPLGGIRRFTVQDSSATPTSAPLTITWALVDNPPAGVQITKDGTFSANSTKPSKNVVTLEATNTATGEKATKTVELVSLLSWPEGWPYLSDEVTTWSDAERRWVGLILYDVLSSIPPDLVKEMGPIPIRRVKELPGSGAHYYYHLTSHYIDVPETTLDFNLGSPPAQPSEHGYRNLGDVLLHELAHAVMSNRCGGHSKRVYDVTALIGEMLSSLMLHLAGVGGVFFALPLLPMELCFAAQADESHSRDFMSQYCKATGWVMNNLSASKVPLLGFALSWLTTEPPNYLTATLPPWLINMRNTGLPTPYAVLKETLEKRNNTLPNWDADVKKLLTDAGMPSLYAAASPQEDFADSLFIALLGDHTHAVHTLQPTVALGQLRKDFFVQHQLLPAGWRTPPPGPPPVPRLYDRPNLTSTQGDTWWNIDTKPAAVPSTATAEAVSARALHHQQVERMVHTVAQWDEGPGKHLARNRDILEKVIPQTEPPTAVTLARRAELHGEGLRPYAETEQTPHPAAVGDLLVGRETTVWMVTHVDAEGRVAAATGRVVGLKPGMTVKDLEVPKEELAYHWSPTAEPRVFASGDTASPGYADLESTLRELIGLWGAEEVPGAQGPDLRTVGGFLHQLLTVAGLADGDTPLQGSESLEGALAYLDTHGAGLVPYVPGQVRVRVGEVLVPFHRNTLALVTRVNARGEPVDVLTGGTHEPGRIGESPGAVKMNHGVDPADFHFRWVPSPKPRAWTPAPEDAMPAVFTDLNAALNHVRNHAGLDTLRRGEQEHAFSSHTPLQVFLGLMLEKGSTPEARAALAPLCWRAPQHALRNFLYLHAGARGRSPVKVGDLFSWKDASGERRSGLALETSTDGAPLKMMVLTQKGVLQVSEVPVSRAALTEVFTLSLQPRELAEEAPARAFYGEPSALAEFVGRRDPGSPWEARVVDSDKRTFFYKEPTHLAGLLTLKAPPSVRERILPRGSFRGVRVAVDTLGEGLARYEPGTQLPLGTWVLADNAIGVVVTRTDKGLPGALLTYSDGGLDYEAFSEAEPQSFWKPSVTPRRYTEDTNDEAYVDLGAQLGRLRLWAYAQSEHTFIDTPFFNLDAYLGEAGLKPELETLLRKGPSSTNDWLAYFMDYGEGLQHGARPRPGDFLFLEGGGRGMALDGGEMLWASNRKLLIEPVQRVKYVWRPTPRQRAVPTA